jgi:hypothetical protein
MLVEALCCKPEKVAGPRPDALSPGVYSASNRNEHGECVRLTNLQPSVSRSSRQCGILNVLKRIVDSLTPSCVDTQELTNILRNVKFHYRVHKNPPLVSILSQINPYRTAPFYLNIIHLPTSRSSNWFVSSFATRVLHAFSSLPVCYVLCPSHSAWRDYSNYTSWRVQVVKLLVMQLSPLPCLRGL